MRAHPASWGLGGDGSEPGAREGTTERRLGEATAQRLSSGGPEAAVVSPDLVKLALSPVKAELRWLETRDLWG